MHVDPSARGDAFILRERGTRYNLENVLARQPKKGVKYHVAGWVNWHSKCEKLEFYNDEDLEQELEHAQEAAEASVTQDHGPRPRKPRRRPTTETTEEYAQRIVAYDKELAEWEARYVPRPKISGKGNSMTQAYYSDRLLPVYLDAMAHIKRQRGHTPILQEDGDPSHGKRKRGVAERRREASGITSLIHPPYSPDLSPIEGCWNIWKQRMRTIPDLDLLEQEEFERIANDTWRDIDMHSIRQRIADLPNRCKMLIKNGGQRIKGGKW